MNRKSRALLIGFAVVTIAITLVLRDRTQEQTASPEAKPDGEQALRETVTWLRTLEPERYADLSLETARALQEIRIDGSEIDPAVNERFRNEDLRHLAALPALKRLELWDTELRDPGLARLGRLTRLESLAIGGWSVKYTDEGLDALRSLRSIKRLKLTHAQHVTDKGMRAVAALPALEFLDITYTRVSHEGLEHLLESTTLQEVDYGWAAETRRWRERFLEDHPEQRFLR